MRIWRFCCLVTSAFISASCATNGVMVPQGFNNRNPYVIGYGKSWAEARKNALRVVPSNYELDLSGENSSSCGGYKEIPLRSSNAAEEAKCQSGTYKTELWVLPKDKVQKAELIQERQIKWSSMRSIEGNTFQIRASVYKPNVENMFSLEGSVQR